MLRVFPGDVALHEHVVVISETISDRPTTRTISAVAELLVC